MARKLAIGTSLLALVLALALAVDLSGETGGEIIRLDPSLDALIPPDAHVEHIADGFELVEGPVWVHKGNQGYLLFSDMPSNVIDKWNPDGKVSVFREKSGFTGTDASEIGYETTNGRHRVTLIGSNGITLDRRGRVTFCQQGDRAVVRLEKNGKLTILADRFEGKRLNSPNDLVYKSDGALYFTDPPYGLRMLDKNPGKELPFNGVYRWSAGKLELLYKDFRGPNGIAFSPDEKYIYIDDSISKTYWRFEVQPDGSIANGKLFFDMSSSQSSGVPDGMKIDKRGNVYGVGPGGVWVISPAGKQLGMIKLLVQPTNLTWGDADGKTLYFTARTGLYRLRLDVQGIRP